MGKVKVKKKARRNVSVGIAYVQATFNNTTVTITDTKGDTLCWASAGTSGFKGSRKSTPFAGQMAAQQAAEKAKKFGVKRLHAELGQVQAAFNVLQRHLIVFAMLAGVGGAGRCSGQGYCKDQASHGLAHLAVMQQRFAQLVRDEGDHLARYH